MNEGLTGEQPTWIVHLLTQSLTISAQEAAMYRRLMALPGVQAGAAFVFDPPARPEGQTLAAFFNHWVLAAERQFLRALPRRFTGLEWRGRSIRKGRVGLESCFAPVISAAAPEQLQTSVSALQADRQGRHVMLASSAFLDWLQHDTSELLWLLLDKDREPAADGYAGFDSVLNGRDTTDIVVSVWSGPQKTMQRRLEIQNRTKLLYVLNQAAVWDRLTSCLLTLLQDDNLLASDAHVQGPERSASSREAPGAPRASAFIRYGGAVGARLLRVLRDSLTGKRGWAVLVASGNPLGDQAARPVRLEAPPGYFYADPMLCQPAGFAMHCFVEEFDFARGKAVIAVLAEQADGAWERVGVALDEPWHLSFPFLFEFGGEMLMCPEAYLSDRITVYRCKQFPLVWESAAILMNNVSAADTVLFPHADKWWLLTSIDRAEAPDHQAELHVYFADSPLAESWTPLQGNPVKVTALGGRNGGFFELDGQLYRCGQHQSLEAYGSALEVFRVELSLAGGYRETSVKLMTLPETVEGKGTHTLSVCADRFAIDILG